jgi:hypothetical protein
MNQYAWIAQRHWAKWLPKRYSDIDGPETFFEILGEEVSNEIEELAAALAGNDPVGETYLAKVGRLNMARLNAESQILRELVLLPPEEDAR